MESDNRKIQYGDFGKDGYVTRLSAAAQKAALWKIDLHVMPWSALLYLINYLDRTNMGAVKIANNDATPKADPLTQLGLSDTDWQLAISVFFIGYVLFELPSNLVIKKFGPARWISRIMVTWGVCAMCMGFCNNLAGLAVARFFLGVAEAGYFPGMMFYLSIWYSQREFGTRCSLFYCSANLAGAFGGLIAYGVSFMNGLGGYAGWRWIFILEGVPAIICGVLTWWVLPGFPHTVSWLSEEELEWIEHRRGSNAPSAKDKDFDKDEFVAVIKDPHAWLMSVMYFMCNLSGYAWVYWLPTIVRNLGFTSTTATLMTVPPYIVAWFVSLAVTWNSDRMQERVWHMICICLLLLVALILFVTIDPATPRGPGVLYFGSFLASCGVFPFIPLVWAWRTGTTKGTTGGATATALMGAVGNIAGAVSTFIFRSDWAPRYVPSFGICIAGTITVITMILIEHYWSMWEAKRAVKEGPTETDTPLAVGTSEA
ncbi:MFS general substrate transporter [Gonapodya prolifera JEL478]|uniref:MFS general substrate transporter n=1 Tax=Gonapodya prolifera (strain JEL478) TaxID=1344416 RepID=A0A139AHB1_GONPJ|nr:MFS general substrate transporter [Gonapodya prolifera JEL478]|eukprot:KXS16089.1 MFS general substrate transporter [Gonapodya prolifera JEL478]